MAKLFEITELIHVLNKIMPKNTLGIKLKAAKRERGGKYTRTKVYNLRSGVDFDRRHLLAAPAHGL